MNKKNKYGKAILVTGFIAIVVVTICAFQKDKIVYKYYEYTIDKKYSKININDGEIRKFSDQISNVFDCINRIKKYKFLDKKFAKQNKEKELRKDEIVNYNSSELISQFNEKE